MSACYKSEEIYWLAEKEYYNDDGFGEREMRYIIKPVKYINPSRIEGRHWVTTLMHPTGEFMRGADGLLLQSVVEGHLKEVEGEWLFRTKEDAERAEELDRRLEKLEKAKAEYKCQCKTPEDLES